jgi:ElaB/YqjD/DUF883 family membrane-anchored ribosome-binding protein
MESHFPIPAGHQSAVARQRVMDDLNNLISDAELLLKATAGDVSEKAREARLQLVATLERAKSTAVELRRRGVELAQKADVVIRDHTYESILTALSFGVIFGFFLGYRRSSED